ncbi:MAG: hypothetical protein EHM33_00550 [Chloroflexi bacterium]|nr:MAG: hypothetical protein EHM33_00550 [Chloroflexota bacterium]
MPREEAKNIRTDILNLAIKALGNRGIQHGEAHRNMHHTAALWSAYLGVEISNIDVAQMMVLLKASRIKCGDNTVLDHYADQCGYSAIGGEIAQKL